ncbi:MAG: flagellar hook-associated protein FlgK [Pseudomonadota bacterium]
MSISGALSSALSGLTANTRQLAVTSDNLANALTKGYGAREVGLTSRGGTGGVRVTEIARALDPELTALRREADGAAAEAETRADGTARLAAAFGELGGSLPGLYDKSEAFQAALRALADTPESTPRQAALLDAATDLAEGFNAASDTAARLRADSDTEIAFLVDRVNSATAEAAELNRLIVRAEAGGRDTASLSDRRETLIDEIAATLPVRAYVQDNGAIELRTAEGTLLVGTSARAISFTPTPSIGPEMVYANGTGALSGLTVGDTNITPGSTGSQAVSGGALAGLFALRDETAPAFSAALDGAAEELAARLAGHLLDPTLAPGDPGLFTDAGAALAAPTAPGLAGRIAVNPAVDPAEGGALWRLRDGLGAAAEGPASTDTIPRALADALASAAPAAGIAAAPQALSFSDRLAALGEIFSTDRVAADAARSGAEASRTALASDEAARLGVDTDRELQALIAIEQAYAANAQVIRTAEAMLDELRRIG